MVDEAIPPHQREFRCEHCNGKISIPRDLPPTAGPCPHCAVLIISPAREFALPPPPPLPPPVAHAADLVLPAPVISPPAAEVSLPNPAHRPPPKIAAPRPPDAFAPPPTPVPHRERSRLVPAALSLLAVVAACGGVLYFATREVGLEIKAPAARAVPTAAAPLEADWQPEAQQLLARYLAAKSSHEKLPSILNGAGLGTALENFYGRRAIDETDTPAEAFTRYELTAEDHKRGILLMVYDLPPLCDSQPFFLPIISLEAQHGLDEGNFLASNTARSKKSVKEPQRIYAFFKRTSDGLKLDWEIFAQTKYRTLRNFTEQPEIGRSGVFRVLVVEDVASTDHDPAGTRIYRIADPAHTADRARIKVPVASEPGLALAPINWRGTEKTQPQTRTATLELTWSGETAAPKLAVRRLICWEFSGLGGQETIATPSTK